MTNFICLPIFFVFLHVLSVQCLEPVAGNNVNQFRQQATNKDHIIEELQHQINTKDQKDFTDKELQFYYFKLHDFDNSNSLDGLEIIKALTHQHDTSGQVDTGEEPHDHSMTEDVLIQTVDGVLDIEDKDNDGYITFAEFSAMQG